MDLFVTQWLYEVWRFCLFLLLLLSIWRERQQNTFIHHTIQLNSKSIRLRRWTKTTTTTIIMVIMLAIIIITILLAYVDLLKCSVSNNNYCSARIEIFFKLLVTIDETNHNLCHQLQRTRWTSSIKALRNWTQAKKKILITIRSN